MITVRETREDPSERLRGDERVEISDWIIKLYICERRVEQKTPTRRETLYLNFSF